MRRLLNDHVASVQERLSHIDRDQVRENLRSANFGQTREAMLEQLSTLGLGDPASLAKLDIEELRAKFPRFLRRHGWGAAEAPPIAAVVDNNNKKRDQDVEDGGPMEPLVSAAGGASHRSLIPQEENWDKPHPSIAYRSMITSHFAPDSEVKDALVGRPGSWMVNPYIWWRHPNLRIFMTFVIMGLDFYIFAEDPVQDSHVEYTFIGIGQFYGLLVAWPDSIAQVLVRVVVILIMTLLGMWFSRQVIHHRFLRNCLGLSMFEQNKGTVFVMGVFELIMLCIPIPYVINLLESGSIDKPLQSTTGKEFAWWGKIWQYISVGLDVVTITTVSDMCLQDKTFHKEWNPCGIKKLWNEVGGGSFRLLFQWICAPTCLCLLYYAISRTGFAVLHEDGEVTAVQNGFHWEASIGGVNLGTTIWMRVFIAAFCAISDIFNLIQDWDFPAFDNQPDIKVSFTSKTELDCSCIAKLLGKCKCNMAKFFTFQMTGKWFAYMSVWGSLCADLSCMKTQFTYRPNKYGQYVEPDTQIIWNIVDKHYLAKAYDEGYLLANKTDLITWEARHDESSPHYNATSAASDRRLSSRYGDDPYWLKFITILPGPLSVIGFAVLVGKGEEWLDSSDGWLRDRRVPSTEMLKIVPGQNGGLCCGGSNNQVDHEEIGPDGDAAPTGK